jgi:DNA polymerase
VTRRPSLADAAAYLADLGFEEAYARNAAPAEAATVANPPDLELPETAGGKGFLERLAGEVAVCRRCRLCEGRNRTVFGSGDVRARLMFVGEGPGAEEDRQGLPFVGRAGELLTKMIQAIHLERDRVYIANVVKCRPPENRDPLPDEVAACRGYLEAQIDTIRPAVLVALGRVAAQSLLGNATPIGRMRGQWYEVRGIPVMVTYHPAALLRNPSLKRPTWEDLQQVRDRLAAAAD